MLNHQWRWRQFEIGGQREIQSRCQIKSLVYFQLSDSYSRNIPETLLVSTIPVEKINKTVTIKPDLVSLKEFKAKIYEKCNKKRWKGKLKSRYQDNFVRTNEIILVALNTKKEIKHPYFAWPWSLRNSRGGWMKCPRGGVRWGDKYFGSPNSVVHAPN